MYPPRTFGHRERGSSFVAVVLVLTTASLTLAKCDPTTDPDKTDIANARAAVAAQCDCATAPTHSAFVNCAASEAHTVLVNKSCAGAVKKCANKSSCGKPGFVSCCRTTQAGRTSCALKSSAAKCVPEEGSRLCRQRRQLLRRLHHERLCLVPALPLW
jgi:hypothetical protein